MSRAQAERVANVMIGAAAIAAAVVVLRTPALRGLAWRLAVTTVTGTVPAWLAREVRDAWEASGTAQSGPAARL